MNARKRNPLTDVALRPAFVAGLLTAAMVSFGTAPALAGDQVVGDQVSPPDAPEHVNQNPRNNARRAPAGEHSVHDHPDQQFEEEQVGMRPEDILLRRAAMMQQLGRNAAVGEVFDALFGDDAFTDPVQPDVEELGVRVLEHPTPRTTEIPNAFRGAPLILEPLGPDDQVHDPGDGRPAINGRVYEISIDTRIQGAWTQLPDGGRLWAMTVMSPNAEGVRLRFEPFNPPAGAELIFYNGGDVEESYGPIGAERARPGLPYWSPTVYGRDMRVEYYLPGEADADAPDEGPRVAPEIPDEAHLSVTGAVQIFPNLSPEPACRLDWTCDATWDFIGLAVAHIHFVSGGNNFICSGTMMNRNPAFDETPYFLTADHCIGTESEANSIEVYWLYQTANCNDPDPGHAGVPRTDGSTLLSEDVPADLSLLGLTPDDIPGGIVWSGWESGNQPNPTSATSIHHPNGVRKSISYGVLEGRDDNRCVNPIDLTYRFDLSDGGQEGGSSGGGVFKNSNQRLVAVISCSEAGCTFNENAWEGSLNAGFNNVSQFLNTTVFDVWVDIGWGGTERGTQAQPWDELAEGYFGVPGTGTMHVEAGSYPAYSFLGTKEFILEAENGTVTIGN